MGVLCLIVVGKDSTEITQSEEGISIFPDSEDFKEPETREELEADLANTQKHAYAKGTLRNLLCQWRSFSRFCRKYHIKEWPIDDHVLALYAQYLGYTFHSPKSIRNYLSGIRTLHVLLKQKPPNLKSVEVRLTLRGLERLLKHEPKQAQPLTPEILLDMLPYLDLTKRADLSFWGVLIVGFFAMLRKSNLVPDSKNSFDPVKHLTGSHVVFQNDVALLKLKWAKNIQFRQKVLEIPLFSITNSALCPVTVLRALVNLQGGGRNPLFGRGKNPTLTYQLFHKKLRNILNKAGYQGNAFSSHSLRRGGRRGPIKTESLTLSYKYTEAGKVMRIKDI